MKNLPSFDPKETESKYDIPNRFFVDGILSLDSEVKWRYQGERIEHHGLLAFLTKQIRRTKEGDYWVVNGPQRALVDVATAPFSVQLLFEKEGQLVARLNDQSEELFQLTKLRMDEQGVLYTECKRGLVGAGPDEGHLCRLSRQAVYALEPYLQEDEEGFFLRFQGEKYTIASWSFEEKSD